MKKEFTRPFEFTINEDMTPVIDFAEWESWLGEAGLNLYNCSAQQKVDMLEALLVHKAIIFGGHEVSKAKVAGMVAVKRFRENNPNEYNDKLEDFCHEGGYMAYVTCTDEFVKEYQEADEAGKERLLEECDAELPGMLYDAKVDLINDGVLYSNAECNHFINGAMYGARVRLEDMTAKDMLKELFPFLTDLNFSGNYFG